MVMRTRVLRRFVEPLLSPDLEHVQNIRMGTKAIAYWPQRFVSDEDADDCLRLFEEVVASGRHLALMGHYSHPVELEPQIARMAVQRIRSTGAQIRMQAPLIRHVNDNPDVWAELWRTGVRLGLIPYYMFVERDTGARNYFEVPLVRCYEIFKKAYSQVSGLARSVRGPSMSAFPGKVRILGIVSLGTMLDGAVLAGVQDSLGPRAGRPGHPHAWFATSSKRVIPSGSSVRSLRSSIGAPRGSMSCGRLSASRGSISRRPVTAKRPTGFRSSRNSCSIRRATSWSQPALGVELERVWRAELPRSKDDLAPLLNEVALKKTPCLAS